MSVHRDYYIYIDTYNQCNLRCRMCGFSNGVAPAPAFLALDVYKSLAAGLFEQTRHLILSCAYEPLMNKTFFNYLYIAGAYAIPRITLTTNGTLLFREISEKLVQSRLTHLHISADGATKETYERIRQGARFDIFLRNVRTFFEIRQAAGQLFPRIQFQFVLLPENLHETAAFVDLVKEFNPYRVLYIHRDFQPPDKQNAMRVRDGLEAALERCVLYHIPFGEIPPVFLKPENVLHAFGKPTGLHITMPGNCPDFGKMLMIRPDGDVFACTGSVFPSGNLYQHGIHEILRDMETCGRDQERCASCVYRYGGQQGLLEQFEQMEAAFEVIEPI